MKFTTSVLLLCVAASLFVANTSATVLTDKNYDDETAGKTVFIKFRLLWTDGMHYNR